MNNRFDHIAAFVHGWVAREKDVKTTSVVVGDEAVPVKAIIFFPKKTHSVPPLLYAKISETQGVYAVDVKSVITSYTGEEPGEE